MPEGFKNKKIAVLMGGPSPEREISIRSGNAVLSALIAKGYNAIGIDVDAFIAENLNKQGIEVAVVMLHGPIGEDGCIQGLLEVMEIPYTGPGVLGASISMNKYVTKELLKLNGIDVPDYIIISSSSPISEDKTLSIPFPVVVKPVSLGSSIGVEIVQDYKGLTPAIKKAGIYSDEVILEKYIYGKEVHIGILNRKSLGTVEVVPKNRFYDYSAKYTQGMTEYIIPARLDESLIREIEITGERVCKSLMLDGANRIDTIVSNDGRIYVLEANAIPGMTETSLLPKIAGKKGINFPDLVEMILNGASLKIKRAKE